LNFDFNPEQVEMAEAARRLLADICSPSMIRAVFDGVDDAAQSRWDRLAELGLLGVLAPDDAAGGLGLAPADFVLLAEESGRAALPEPLAEHAGIAVPALAELSAPASLVAAATSGESGIAVLHPQNAGALLPPRLSHWLIFGDDAVWLHPAAEVDARDLASIDVGRRLAVPAGLPAGVRPLVGGDRARRAAADALDRGALYAAAQSLGLAERLLQLAVDYAKERKQFGRAVGSYQGLKHQLAEVRVKLEFARPVVYSAAARLGSAGARTPVAVSHAKLAAGDAADLAARTAIQVHGAMGYSWEVDLHFYMKRVWALSGAWGDRSFHARRVQSHLTAGAFALGPDMTFEDGKEPQGTT
jgi:alkylation response protein AidB-like acyl-CoA dehydrogenase